MTEQDRCADSLRSLRQKVQLSQAEVARAIGVSQQSVASWESGVTVPSVERREKLSLVLACSPERIDEVLVRRPPVEGSSKLRAEIVERDRQISELRGQLAQADEMLRLEREKVRALLSRLPPEDAAYKRALEAADAQIQQMQVPNALPND